MDDNKKFYIEDIDIEEFKKSEVSQESGGFPIQQYEPKLPMKASEHIFQITGPEDEKAIINYVKSKDYVADKQLIDFINEKAPELKKYFYQAPISISELKEQVRAFFGDVPNNLFEGSTYLDVITKILNHIIRKETAEFIIFGIRSGKLVYYEKFYPHMYSAFYRVAKFNFHIPSYHLFIELYENFLENHFWKVMFADRDEITIQNLTDIRTFYNFLGRQYTDIIDIQTKQLIHLKDETIWIKRTTFKTLPTHWSEVALAKKNIAKTIEQLKKMRGQIFSRRQNIEALLDKKVAIKKDQIETLLSGKWGAVKLKVKQWAGLYK